VDGAVLYKAATSSHNTEGAMTAKVRRFLFWLFVTGALIIFIIAAILAWHNILLSIITAITGVMAVYIANHLR